MAKITKIDPAKWKSANVVQLDVDAENNTEAIVALEDWAAENGFARIRENFLRIVITKNRKQVFRGACYRVTDEERKAVRFEIEAINRRARKIGESVRPSKAAG